MRYTRARRSPGGGGANEPQPRQAHGAEQRRRASRRGRGAAHRARHRPTAEPRPQARKPPRPLRSTARQRSAERTDGAHRRLCRKRATAPNLGFAQDADSTKERGTFCIRHLRKIKVKFGATARRRLRRRQSRECVGAELCEVAAPRRAR